MICIVSTWHMVEVGIVSTWHLAAIQIHHHHFSLLIVKAYNYAFYLGRSKEVEKSLQWNWKTLSVKRNRTQLPLLIIPSMIKFHVSRFSHIGLNYQGNCSFCNGYIIS